MSDHFPDVGENVPTSLPARVVVDRHTPTGVVTYGYTDEIVRAYAAEQVAAERERCEKLREEVAYSHPSTSMLGPEQNALKCAARIRGA